MDGTIAPLAFTIPQFCQAHNVSRSQYYEMKKDGSAPVEMKIGRKKLISHESAADWRRRMEVPPDPEPSPADEAETNAASQSAPLVHPVADLAQKESAAAVSRGRDPTPEPANA